MFVGVQISLNEYDGGWQHYLETQGDLADDVDACAVEENIVK